MLAIVYEPNHYETCCWLTVATAYRRSNYE